MKDTLTIEIPYEMLPAAIEAMSDLQNRYEAEACALARLPSADAQELAQARLESAKVAADLFNFFVGQ